MDYFTFLPAVKLTLKYSDKPLKWHAIFSYKTLSFKYFTKYLNLVKRELYQQM